jgi:hypothetical protein
MHRISAASIFLHATDFVSNEAPRPEAEVSGRPPRGGRFREVAPVGGVNVKRTEASPDRSAEATPNSLSEGHGQEEHPEEARRIARSSSGHTARGRGFIRSDSIRTRVPFPQHLVRGARR